MSAEMKDDDMALRAFRKVHPAWPTFARDSFPRAERAWLALTEAERAEAAARMADYIEAVPRTKLCTFGVYLAEKRWQRLPPPAPRAAVSHPPFGKAWSALRLATLLGPLSPLPPLTATLARMVEQGGPLGERILRQHRERWGWPLVVKMDEKALRRQRQLVPARIADLGGGFEQVRVGSARWDEWRAEHEARGWPWLPDTGAQQWVYFPAGGPARLGDFEDAVGKAEGDDAV